MTTTPDYAGLIDLLEMVSSEVAPGMFSSPGLAKTMLPAFRTLLESNAALERERDEQWQRADVLAQQNAYHKDRAEAAEAHVKKLERLTDGIDHDRRGALDLCLERNKQIAALEAERDRLKEMPPEPSATRPTPPRKDRAMTEISEKEVNVAARAAFDAWWNDRGPGAETSWLSTKDQWAIQTRAALEAAALARAEANAGEPVGWTSSDHLEFLRSETPSAATIHNKPNEDMGWTIPLYTHPAAPTAGGGDAE